MLLTHTVEGGDFSPDEITVTFPPSSPINGTVVCEPINILDDNIFEGDDQEFTVEISSVEYESGPSANLMCMTDCTATVTLEDDPADCECLV